MVGPTATGPGGRGRRSRPLLRAALGDVLRRVRLRQGRTLADVASAAKVSLPYLSELERGRKEASSEILAAICDALRIELADLLAETGRHLAADHAQPGPVVPVVPVVPLEAGRGQRLSCPARGQGDAQCLLAA